MIVKKCKSLFNGKASIGSHILTKAKIDNETIRIEHDGFKMTVPASQHYKFHTFGNGKTYLHKNGSGSYQLKYIDFKPDEETNA